jgi:hypothetical protein
MISERTFARSFDSFWRELLPLLSPRYMSLFNEAYEHELADSTGQRLKVLPFLPANDRPDAIAEFAFRLAELTHESHHPHSQVNPNSSTQEEAATRALQLILKYNSKKSFTNPLSESERDEVRTLFQRYNSLISYFPANSEIKFCPKIPGAGFLDSCEADLSIGSCLIEVKTTLRRPLSKDLRQLLIYFALDSNTSSARWKEFGLFNPRRGTVHHIAIEPFVLHISGGRPPLDVFSDIIAFTETNELIVDKRF